MQHKVQVALLSLSGALAWADTPPEPERRVYVTQRATQAPVLDGRLDDPAWQAVAWSGDFVQREPTEGKPPTQQTQFKVLYDDDAIYFAFQAFDDPGQLSNLLARRDRFPGDWIEINIDSYADRRTGFSFTLSLSGTRGDEFISNDGDRWDGNWDPIWSGATHVDEQGWTAEARIPLSQLRFSSAPEQTWGLQVQRLIFKQNERSTWQTIPKAASGWVSRFGELRGIQGVKPKRRLELLPYAVAKADKAQAAGNPFRDGTASSLTGGLDGKFGVSSSLTTDLTVNPDFGQVEADPSEVNLTAFETFFQERRPFFVEGSDIFDLPLAPAITGGHFTSDRLFYSRRIGGRPPYSPSLEDHEYADQPQNTSILGAAKLSGKTPGGLSVGVLESLTSRESAPTFRGGRYDRESVAPLINNFVGRLQQDYRAGDTQVGLMFTALHRSDDLEPRAYLTRQAYAGGFDFSHYLGDRDYRLEGNLLASTVRGDARAITDVQTSSARYFQRPDNTSADLDPTRTDLGGHAGSLRLTRTVNNSGFRFQTGAAWRSPGFEINDLGFMRRADELNQFGWAAYQWRNPFSIFRRLQINANEWFDWDFSGQLLRKAVNTNGHAMFLNNYRVGGGVTWQAESISNTELRGGPSSRWPGVLFYDTYVGTDERKRLSGVVGFDGRHGDESSESLRRYWTEATYRPTNALTFAVSPSYALSRRTLQYIDTRAFEGDPRYVFGRLDQRTLALTVRADLSLTPNLTVQYYGAPFVSSGRYDELKRITDPRARAFTDRYANYAPGQLSASAAGIGFDENRDGVTDYSIDAPNFDVREFNSTLVVRWEYRPGSQLYVVWSQARSDDLVRQGSHDLGQGLRDVFRASARDVFLIKLSRWLSL